MQLSSYLPRGGRPKFAAQLGVSVSTIHRICQRKQRPSDALKRRIVEATGGKVTLEDLTWPEAAAAK